MSTRPSATPTAANLAHVGSRGVVLKLLVFLFVAAGIVATFAVTASGQDAQYETIKMHPAFSDAKVVTQMERAAGGLVGFRDNVANFPQMTYAKVYFESYIPAKITQPDAVGEISTLVQESMNLLSRAQRSKAPGAATILPWIYAGMKKVAEGNYQPAARINATLVLGRLDEQPADNIAQRPPVPLRYSLPVLLKLYQDQGNPDGVRAAALTGLHRYVSYALTLSPEDRNTLTTAMAELLAAEAPANRSADAHAYLQRYAVDMLGMLGKSKDPQFGSQLIGISKQAEQPDLIALYSAATVGSMKEGLQGQVGEPEALLSSWSVRAMRAFQQELARLNALTRPAITSRQPPAPDTHLRTTTSASAAAASSDGDGMMESMSGASGAASYDSVEMMGDMGMGMMGMGARVAAKPQPPEVFASRRKLNHVLQQLHLGVTGSPTKGLPSTPGGLLASVGEDKKQAILDWVASMEKVVTALNDKALDDRKKFAAALAEQVKMLTEIAGADAVEAANKVLADKGLPVPGVESLVEDEPPAEAGGLAVPGLPAGADELGIPVLPVVDELAAP